MYKFALVGCGRISVRHAENIQRVGTLTAVCDIVPEKADGLVRNFQAKAYYSIDDMLREEKTIDIVVICTPNGLHAEHSVKALEHGKHVLCEKPMCLSTSDAIKMMASEKVSQKKLFVVKSARFNPLLQQLKIAISKNELGRIYSFQLSCFWHRSNNYYSNWHGKISSDGGTLYTQFSHYIDALLWLLGDVESLNGYRTNAAHGNIIEFEDTGVMCCKTADGALGTINWSVNTYQKNSEISLTIIAEKGTVSFGGEYLNQIKYLQSDVLLFSGAEKNLPNDYNNYRGSMSHHDEIYNNLAEALQNDEHCFGNSTDGLKTVEIIERIYKTIPLAGKEYDFAS
jgi:UDP-N-acetyl-2-amino-2-deoxyglucuronate dehydrogenase